MGENYLAGGHRTVVYHTAWHIMMDVKSISSRYSVRKSFVDGSGKVLINH